MENYLSLINLVDSLKIGIEKENKSIEVLDYSGKYNSIKERYDKLTTEHSELADSYKKLLNTNKALEDELESLKKVSIIRNMNKQIQDLTNKNEILERKITFYKTNYDLKSESLSLTGTNFDDIKSYDKVIDEDTCDKLSEESETEYNISEHLARLLNIPIETKLTMNDANQRVRDYISDNKLHCNKTLSLKYDWKLFHLLNIEDTNDVDAKNYLLNLNKIIRANGFVTSKNEDEIELSTTNKNSEDTVDEVEISEEEYISDEEEYISDEEEEVFEVKKIGKRYYYISRLDNSVYKAVKNKVTKEYELGKKVGVLDGEKINKTK